MEICSYNATIDDLQKLSISSMYRPCWAPNLRRKDDFSVVFSSNPQFP